jgi:hypothetical protein
MPIVPGFQYDLFVSYAHRNDAAWREGAPGWVTDFVRTLKGSLEERNRDFKIWFDPALRTGEDFNAAIAKAISESAVFLSVLSPAYDESTYCRREVTEFRQQRHPTFGMKVGTLSRMQAIVLEAVAEDRWPVELRSTSPYSFYSENTPRFYKPSDPDAAHPYVRGLWKVRDSVLAALEEMRKQKERGTAIEHSYNVRQDESFSKPRALLAEVSDDLYSKREKLRSALQQLAEFRVEDLPGSEIPVGPEIVSVHLFGIYPGRPAPGQTAHVSRLQLEAALAANPARRPIVWLAPELKPESGDTEAHQQFLKSLLENNSIELLRMGFEDLKSEIQQRMRPKTSPVVKNVRRLRDDPIVHIWHHSTLVPALGGLKQFLKSKNCAICVFPCPSPPELQSKLAAANGLIVPYTAESKSWAEDVIMTTFQLRRRQESPVAYAAVELPPRANGDFNFEHSRVFRVHTSGETEFRGFDEFLETLENEDV